MSKVCKTEESLNRILLDIERDGETQSFKSFRIVRIVLTRIVFFSIAYQAIRLNVESHAFIEVIVCPDQLDPIESNHHGLIFLPTLIVMVMISLLLLTWYQQEIQHRFQAQSFFRMQTIYQELNGVISLGKEHIRHFSEAELNQPNLTLESSKFAPYFLDWNAEITPADTSLKMRLNYHSHQEVLVSFEALFVKTRHHLFDIPWIVLTPSSESMSSSFLHLVDTEDSQFNHPRILFLKSSEIIPASEIFSGDYDITWNPSAVILRQGSQQKIITLGSMNTTIFIDGTATVQMESIPDYASWVLLHTTQDMMVRFPEKPAQFPTRVPAWFAIVGGNLLLHAVSDSISSTQMSGYFYIQGEHCLQNDNAPDSIYWLGSLACEHAPPNLTISIYLKHHIYPQPGPENFQRSSLQFQGVRLLEN